MRNFKIGRRNVRVALLVSGALLLSAVPIPARAEAPLLFDQCYLVAIARPRPAAQLNEELPPGFTATELVPGVGQYGILAQECTEGSGIVDELISHIAVTPPPHLALPSGNPMYFLRQGTTSSPAAAAIYAQGCLPNFELGAVDLGHAVTSPVRTATVAAEHSSGPIEAAVYAPEPDVVAFPGGLIRVFSVTDDMIGVLDIRVGPQLATAPLPSALVTEAGMTEVGLGYHVFPGKNAPGSWEIVGARCVGM